MYIVHMLMGYDYVSMEAKILKSNFFVFEKPFNDKIINFIP